MSDNPYSLGNQIANGYGTVNRIGNILAGAAPSQPIPLSGVGVGNTPIATTQPVATPGLSTIGAPNAALNTWALPKPLQDMKIDLMTSQKNAVDYSLKKQQDADKSVIGQMSPYLDTASKAVQGISSLANIYLGFERLGLMEDQIKIAKEQWGETKQELAHVKGVRKKINSNYMA